MSRRDRFLAHLLFSNVKPCIAPRRNHTCKALRYGTRSEGILQFYLHTPCSSANVMNHTCHQARTLLSSHLFVSFFVHQEASEVRRDPVGHDVVAAHVQLYGSLQCSGDPCCGRWENRTFGEPGRRTAYWRGRTDAQRYPVSASRQPRWLRDGQQDAGRMVVLFGAVSGTLWLSMMMMMIMMMTTTTIVIAIIISSTSPSSSSPLPSSWSLTTTRK